MVNNIIGIQEAFDYFFLIGTQKRKILDVENRK